MSLTGWDKADLDRIAREHADRGKRKAWHAYHGHAAASGWGDTPAWIEGRTLFTRLWRRYRGERATATAQLAARFGSAE